VLQVKSFSSWPRACWHYSYRFREVCSPTMDSCCVVFRTFAISSVLYGQLQLVYFQNMSVFLCPWLFIFSMEEIHSASQDSVNGIPSRRPVIEMTIPSVLDKTISPPGTWYFAYKNVLMHSVYKREFSYFAFNGFAIFVLIYLITLLNDFVLSSKFH